MGRLRMNKKSLPYLVNSKLVSVNPTDDIIDWNKKIFKNNNPIWIEIGMGKGEFTLKTAEINPNINLIGIEKYPTVQQIPVKKAEESILSNLHFISGDASDIDKWFKKESIDKIFINFPDPWPKEKHSKRRLINKIFLKKYYELLKNNGKVEFKTDHLDLFNFLIEEVNEQNIFTLKNKVNDLHSLENKNLSPIKTGYEKKFSALGNKINYVELHKNK